MSTEIPVAAIATVVASLIAAAVAFVNLTLNKEQKTSEFRQAWIDGLRQDLALFFAGARAFARTCQEYKKYGKDWEHNPLSISKEKISEIRFQAAETRYRILLRLNLKEEKHIELLRLIQLTIDEQNKMLAGERNDITETIMAIDDAVNFAPQVLKAEWERVKKGELPFRIARNWVIPFILVSALFTIIVWSTNIKF